MISKLILLFAFALIFSQSEIAQVESVLMDYIEGTSMGQPDRLKRAFEEQSALYTIGKENELVRRPSDQYIALFKEGQKNSRKGQITYIDVVNNAATAIVEIVMGKRVYTDYILLLKIKDQWKIINKSYTFVEKPYRGKILFVVSNVDRYGESNKRTGTHFGELVSLYDEFINAGFEIDFVSPNGGNIPVAYLNLQSELERKYFYDTKLNYKLKTTSAPNEIEPLKYKAMIYVGGSASMYDIPENTEIISIAKRIYEQQKGILGAVCHGVAGLVNIKLSSGEFLVKGKVMNSFTNKEEAQAGNEKLLPFLIESRLKDHGATFKSSDNWKEHVEVDGRIVTGQNPASSKALVKEIVKLIN